MKHVKMFESFLNESKDQPSLAEVNAHIKTKYPDLDVEKHHDTKGSYYWYSEEDKLALYLAGLYSTTIDVANTKHQSLDTWMKDADEIMKDFK